MTKWTCVEMSETDSDAGGYAQITKAFGDALLSAPTREGVAMYMNSLRQVGRIFYFSPEANRVLPIVMRLFNSVPCDSPPTSGLVFLLGDAAFDPLADL